MPARQTPNVKITLDPLLDTAQGRWDTVEAKSRDPALSCPRKFSEATGSLGDGVLASLTAPKRPSAYPLRLDLGGRLPTFHHEPSDGQAWRSRMSATVRTVFGMSSSAAHRLDGYGQVEVNFFKTGLPAPYHRESGLSMPDERPNGGRTLGAGGYANHIGGAKNGTPATHPLSGRDYASSAAISGKARLRRSCLSRNAVRRYPAPGFSRLVERAATAADLGIKAHAHMLRHACGFELANDGVDAAPSKLISATSRSSIRCVTPSLRLRGSKAYSGTDRTRTRGLILKPLSAVPDCTSSLAEFLTNLDECSMGPFLR